MRRGIFVVVEGIDGSGSTTQARRLHERLSALGHASTLTAEPSTGPVGALLRGILQHRVVVPTQTGSRAPDWSTMALLFAADRLDHVDALIQPALAQGHVVISDRYVLSSLTYQSLTAPSGEQCLPWLRAINAEALVPDLTLVLDVLPEVAAQRRSSRGGERELFEAEELQRGLARAYLRAEQLLPESHVTVHIDGNRDATAIAAELEAHVLKLLSDRS